jgi:hypothetical protein
MLNMETVVPDPKTGELRHELYFNLELDMARAQYNDPAIKEKLNSVCENLNNALHMDDEKQASKVRGKAMVDMADAVRGAYKSVVGCDVVCYKDAASHIESLKPMIEAGAKGSYAKLADYCKYYGTEVEQVKDASGKTTDVKFIRDVGHSLATNEDREASFNASHAKAILTGLAGVSLQKAILQGKNVDAETAKAAMALTHPVTQRVLQLKHDGPEEVNRVIGLIQDVNPAIWSGAKICESKDGSTWEIARNDKGKPIQATPEEWIDQVNRFYTAKNGFNVAQPNPEYVKKMAAAMTVTDEYGKQVIQGYDNMKYKDPNKNGHCPGSQPLDDMMYFGSFQKFKKYCEENVDLYAGDANAALMPREIRKNRREIEEAEIWQDDPQFVRIAAKDTRAKSADTPVYRQEAPAVQATPVYAGQPIPQTASIPTAPQISAPQAVPIAAPQAPAVSVTPVVAPVQPAPPPVAAQSAQPVTKDYSSLSDADFYKLSEFVCLCFATDGASKEATRKQHLYAKSEEMYKKTHDKLYKEAYPFYVWITTLPENSDDKKFFYDVNSKIRAKVEEAKKKAPTLV